MARIAAHRHAQSFLLETDRLPRPSVTSSGSLPLPPSAGVSPSSPICWGVSLFPHLLGCLPLPSSPVMSPSSPSSCDVLSFPNSWDVSLFPQLLGCLSLLPTPVMSPSSPIAWDVSSRNHLSGDVWASDKSDLLVCLTNTTLYSSLKDISGEHREQRIQSLKTHAYSLLATLT